MVAVVETLQDLSDRRKAEEALRESETRFRSLCEAAPVGIYLCDSEGRSTYGNPIWLSLAGLSAEENLGTDWSRAIHPEDLPAVVTAWQEAAAAGAPCSKKHRLLRPDGSVRWIRALASLLPAPDGSPAGYVGTVEDISERRKAAERLRQSEEQLRAFFEADLVGTLMGHVDGRILKVNDRFLQHARLCAGRAATAAACAGIGSPRPNFCLWTQQAIAEAKRRGTCTPYEKQYLCQDGSARLGARRFSAHRPRAAGIGRFHPRSLRAQADGAGAAAVARFLPVDSSRSSPP